jgi:hypothetical protein
MKKSINPVLLTAASTLGLACLAQPASAASIHVEDFNSNDGGYVAALFDPISAGGAAASGPWVVGPNGVGSTNAWSAIGGEGGPYEHHLTSPVITVPGNGSVSLEFDHKTLLEGAWDGGVIMTSVNGAAFKQLTDFSENGYNDTMQSSNSWEYPEGIDSMVGLAMFSGDSGGFVHSVGDLGILGAGDTLQVQFRGGWDWGFVQGGGAPEWIVDNVTVNQAVPEPSSTLLIGMAGLALVLRKRSRK